MFDFKDIEIDDRNFRLMAERSGTVTTTLLLQTINNIARDVEQKAKEFAPIGKAVGGNRGYVPGKLKAEGIIREDAHAFETPGDTGDPGSFVTTTPAIGGGFSVRGGNPGNRGQFSRRPGGAELTPGTRFTGIRPRTFVEAEVLLNPLVPHAKWVHQGTGIYGPHHHPIVPRVAPYLVFRWHGRMFVKKSVRGQVPQPFLTEAYIYVNNISTPAKVSVLKAELSAEL